MQGDPDSLDLRHFLSTALSSALLLSDDFSEPWTWVVMRAGLEVRGQRLLREVASEEQSVCNFIERE